MFGPVSKKNLIGRAGGTSDLGMGIPKDKERHATQAALIQKGGVSKEPAILIKRPEGYDLLEGWHRTIQHFAKYPEGYTGPAYVAVAQGQQGVAEGKQPGQPVVDAILKVMPVAQEIWFHGSRATGKHRRNSDTDILVVVPDDLVGDQYLGVVRILQKLSSHLDNYDIQPTKAGTNIHRIAQEEGRLLWSNKQDMAENFADGRNPQDKGDAKRHGINTKASVSSLRKTAKQGGRKGQLAHWLANMKSGRAKKK
jgi:predicted nucleotidyltransferase